MWVEKLSYAAFDIRRHHTVATRSFSLVRHETLVSVRIFKDRTGGLGDRTGAIFGMGWRASALRHCYIFWICGTTFRVVREINTRSHPVVEPPSSAGKTPKLKKGKNR